MLLGIHPAGAHSDDPHDAPHPVDTAEDLYDDLREMAADLAPFEYDSVHRVLMSGWSHDGGVVYATKMDFESPTELFFDGSSQGDPIQLSSPFNSEDNQRLNHLEISGDARFAVAVVESGNSGAFGRELVRWDLENPSAAPVSLHAGVAEIGSIAISDNGLFVIVRVGNEWLLLDSLNGALVSLPEGARNISISGDGSAVVFTTSVALTPDDNDGLGADIYRWSRLGGQIELISGNDEFSDFVAGRVVASEDGKTIATSLYHASPPDGSSVWSVGVFSYDDAARGYEFKVVAEGHEGFRWTVGSLDLSPDGRLVSFLRNGDPGRSLCTSSANMAVATFQIDPPVVAAGVTRTGSLAVVFDLETNQYLMSGRVQTGRDVFCGLLTEFDVTAFDETTGEFDAVLATNFPTPSLNDDALEGSGLNMHLLSQRPRDYSLCATTDADGNLVDSDGDCLSNEDEIAAGSNPYMTDTDGDQLLDAWEVRSYLGGVIKYPNGQRVDPEDVFYDVVGDTDQCLRNHDVEAKGRISMAGKTSFRCLNQFPDPIVADLYYELDWQDCLVRDSCPNLEADLVDFLAPAHILLPDQYDIFPSYPVVMSLDPNHHGPDLEGLRSARELFGSQGINLNIVVNKGSWHRPYCFNGDGSLDGNAGQEDPDASYEDRVRLRAPFRANVYRLIYSGHSTFQGDCDYEDFNSFLDLIHTGVGSADLPAFDNTPFGDTNVGGSISAVSLGIPWACSTRTTPHGRVVSDGDSVLGYLGIDVPTELGGCFRNTFLADGELRVGLDPNPLATSVARRIGLGFGLPQPEVTIWDLDAVRLPAPGIYPARVPDDGGVVDLRWPTTLAIGESEADAHTQLWARSITHLVLHDLGYVSDEVVGNYPAPMLRRQEGPEDESRPLLDASEPTWPSAFDMVTKPDAMGNGGFGALAEPIFRPKRVGVGLDAELLSGGVPMAEPGPDLVAMMSDDPDDDGRPTGADNCPAVYNPEQEQWSKQINDLGGHVHLDIELTLVEFGDACNEDVDGDGLPEGQGAGLRIANSLAAAVNPVDPFPRDFDNDGLRDDIDPDRDGDDVPDEVDNCVGAVNPAQGDADGDGIGDSCELDPDNDGSSTLAEVLVGSNPFDALSTPEITRTASCSDGIDNDLDGLADLEDPGCQNADGDIYPDSQDLCPQDANTLQTDSNGNGVGDQCEPEVLILYDTGDDLTAAPTTELTIITSVAGTLEIRVDGIGCEGGTLLDSQPISDELTVTVNAADLTATKTRVEACVRSGPGWGTDAIYVTGPEQDRVSLTVVPASDTGVSSTDGVTAATAILFKGLGAPDEVVELRRDGVVVATATATKLGEFVIVDSVPAAGQHDYVATSAGTASEPVLITSVFAGPAVEIEQPLPQSTSVSYTTTATSTACTIDFVPVECTQPLDISRLGEGDHSVRVDGYNDAGALTMAVAIWTVTSTGNPPIANDDWGVVELGLQDNVEIDVLANDIDEDGDIAVATLEVTAHPANGQALIIEDESNPTIGYIPNAAFSGSDSFMYRVCDSSGLCDTATVVVQVIPANIAPQATDDEAVIETNSVAVIDVLDNDVDPDDGIDESSLSVVVEPVSGTSAVASDAESGFWIEYTPDIDFSGVDTLAYRVCDNTGACDDAVVTITVGSSDCTILGTPGDDVLRGTDGPDVICGLGGDDTIRGLGGDDIIRGGRGADTIFGGDGDDIIFGARGNDELRGGTGNDLLRGGRGSDSLYGGAGNDELHGGRGRDIVQGGAGDDLLFSGAGSDEIHGGSGNDIIRGRRGADVLRGDAGDDMIFGGAGADELHGGTGNDLLYGRRGNDELFGGRGNDELRGNRGRDRLMGGADDDLLVGGRADDHADGGGGVDRCVAESTHRCE